MKRSIMFVSLAVVFILGAALFFLINRSQSVHEQTVDPTLIAKVGPLEIRLEDLQREMRRRGGAHPEHLDKNMLLKEMIEDEVLMARAIETGLNKDPEIIMAYRNMLISALKKKHLLPRIKEAVLTDAEVKDYYESHPDEFTRPAKVRLALLYMTIPSRISPNSQLEAVWSKMNEVREKALNIQDKWGFGSLAVTYSEDQATRYKGGDIGWVEEGKAYRWEPAVLAAGFVLENIGDISEVISTDDGLYLVKLLDHRPSEVIPQDKAASRIRHQLMRKKEQEIKKTFQQEMQAATTVKIYSEILESVPLPSDTVPKEQLPPKLQ